jgi:hypothetical protein
MVTDINKSKARYKDDADSLTKKELLPSIEKKADV